MIYPKPSKIASLQNIKNAWKASRDSKGRGGAPGIDKVRPLKYKENFETNIKNLRSKLLNGSYSFSSLKPNFIEKSDGQWRVICVPTVEDRLVQRLVLHHLCNKKDRLNVLTPNISYGVGRGTEQGVHAAIKQAIKKRNKSPWVLKTDVTKFFDQIPREHLLKRVNAKLGNSSLIPILESAIQCEVKAKNSHDREKLDSCGLVKGVGLRQGMPLSPILSKLVLSAFDRKARRRKYNMVRYADDIIIFCDSKEECEKVLVFVKQELEKLKLSVPSIESVNGKTEILAPDKAVIFLGVEIYQSGERKYLTRIPAKTVNYAKEKIKNHSHLNWNIQEGYSYATVVQRLKSIPDGYKAAFYDCTNVKDLLKELEKLAREVKKKLLIKVFGKNVFESMTAEQKKFMGFE